VLVLGIETATRLCSAGLAGPSGMVAEYRIRTENNQGERLANTVSVLLHNTGLTISQIEGIAVSIGPGSFTGLRIGLGFVKGLAFGRDLPIVAVSTFDGLASMVPAVFPRLCVQISSKKGEVYQGMYVRQNTDWVQSSKPEILEADRIGEGLSDEATVFMGDGAVINEMLIRKNVAHPVFFPEMYSYPSGYVIAAEGRRRLLSGILPEPPTLVPQYLRRFQGIE
jgi:tRNA threonylcarbamoyladenosine biosynthesis protein TsaB